ncbi:porin [Herminiimonas sp. CN]|uniref:porin n=1 Tax=Herminiimonas sp. CN TaxID=1349818 RepID=UPI0004738366|nr:porin [Herminiimonas sp. CN]
MKKTLIALAVLGSVASVAQAQSNVTIYGVLDASIVKTTGIATSMQSGDNNRIGFKGTEDLGGGLSATFQIEQRFDIDTGTNEAGTRPLFQGRSTVGLAGGFGSIKLGRELTAKQATAAAFDPWGATRNRGAFNPDLGDAYYNSSVLANGVSPEAAGNRWSNGVFYNSPVMSGFQANVSVATKEAQAGVTPPNVPYSLTGTYNNGPIAAALSYERNNVDTKFWSLAGSYNVGIANLMATYAQQKFTDDEKIKAWTIGARVNAGPGDVLVGYGQARADNVSEKAKKFAIGYEYKLSKRTYVYADAINYKNKFNLATSTVDTRSVNTFDIGLHHSF